MASRNLVTTFLAHLGVLRVLLVGAGVIAIVFATAPGTPPVYAGWALLPTLLIPVLVPLVFLMLVFDSIMSAVFMIDKRGQARTRYQTVILVNLVVAVLILVRWLAYYRAL